MAELGLEKLTENEMTGKDYYGQLTGTQNNEFHITNFKQFGFFFFEKEHIITKYSKLHIEPTEQAVTVHP